MNKRKAQNVDRGLIALALILMTGLIVAGMWMITTAVNDVARQMIQAIVLGSGVIGVIGLLKMIQSVGIRKSVEEDTDTTVQIANKVQQDLTHTQEVKKTVDEVHEKVNGGMEERLANAVLIALRKRDEENLQTSDVNRDVPVPAVKK